MFYKNSMKNNLFPSDEVDVLSSFLTKNEFMNFLSFFGLEISGYTYVDVGVHVCVFVCNVHNPIS